MLTVLWSTPRTGSTYYSSYLLSEYNKQYPNITFLRQYFNKFHLNSYIKTEESDLVYDYDPKCFYMHYYLQAFSNRIMHKFVYEKRNLDSTSEEAYRIVLLEKTNLKKYPVFISQHIQPMSKDTFYYLKYKANRNIFIYRENFIDQLASYVVAMHTKTYRKTEKTKINPVTDAEIDLGWLDDLASRIKYWHTIDKTGCEVIKYEDIKFDDSISIKKQHDVKPINQVSQKTYDTIMKLNDGFQLFLESKQKTL